MRNNFTARPARDRQGMIRFMVEEDDARSEIARHGLDPDEVDTIHDLLTLLEHELTGHDLDQRARFAAALTSTLIRARARITHPSTRPELRPELERRARTYAAAALLLAATATDAEHGPPP